MANTKILVVEDELIVAIDIEKRLNKLGYTVTSIATSGEEAIENAAEKSPDLVLMDIQLKGRCDGVEAAKEIYNHFNIPVIYLTANADESTLERAKVTEPFGYILKPFKEKELKTSIEITLTKHRRENQLKQSEQWLATVLKSIGDAVITSDRNGEITFMNPVAEFLTGWRQEEAGGRDVTEVFNIRNDNACNLTKNLFQQVLQYGVTFTKSEQTILIAKNGVEIPVEDSVAPIKDDKDNITGAVLVFRDITERKRAEEARQKQIEQERLLVQLERLNQLKDDFLSTVSHELRTPISNMKMAIQMLKIAGASHERSQSYLEILQRECAREIQLIDSLLDLQRLEAASYPVFLIEKINLQEWLPGLVEPFRVRTQQHEQTLEVNIAPNLSPLAIDRSSLERILAELLNNACKYTPTGGGIVLSVMSKKAIISTQLEEQSCGRRVFLSVSNQAEIPQAELPRIFEKFYRVPQADPWKQGGTGLGLALVQKLVEQMQGAIQVESSNGWTTATVIFTDATDANA